MYLTPKFNTCGSQIELAGWPVDKTEDDFRSLLETTVMEADNAFTDM